MAGRSDSADFVEALARGLDIIQTFTSLRPRMTLAQVAEAADLTRPTARRLLLTLSELGFVRQLKSEYELTPRVLDLGSAYVESLGLWDIARPHLMDLVERTGESSSMSQLEGSDIVYTARVSVPKIIAFRVEIGTRFPAAATSQGKVLLAGLSPQDLERALATPSRSHVKINRPLSGPELEAELDTVRDRGWALADEELAPGIRSIAAPVRDESGEVHSTVNVTVHAAETSREQLLDEHLPQLLKTASEISADWARWRRRPHIELDD
ncbi:IclR family transcriptional regulator [Arthrobacter pigmenti]